MTFALHFDCRLRKGSEAGATPSRRCQQIRIKHATRACAMLHGTARHLTRIAVGEPEWPYSPRRKAGSTSKAEALRRKQETQGVYQGDAGERGRAKSCLDTSVSLCGCRCRGDNLVCDETTPTTATATPARAGKERYQQAVEASHKMSAELRSAEDRIKELEALARHHEVRAERAEQWLYQISVEIEQRLFSGSPPPPLR
jgi:DNA repair ATPase RecN